MDEAAATIYHLATPPELAEAQQRGSVAPRSLAVEITTWRRGDPTAP